MIIRVSGALTNFLLATYVVQVVFNGPSGSHGN